MNLLGPTDRFRTPEESGIESQSRDNREAVSFSFEATTASRHPTTERLARQITEVFPWASAPAYLVRDNDGAYGHVITRHGYSRPTDLA
jgi:hypothetical protein